MHQDSEIPGKKAAILRAKSEVDENPYFYFTELFSPQEKQYIQQQKERLEDEISSLKTQISDLESKNKSKQQYISKGELFELKYQIIDSFYTENIQSYIDMIHSYDQIQNDNIELRKKIIFYEEKIENQFELRKSIIEENDQLKSLLDFTDLTYFYYPELTNVQSYNFTKINIEGIEKENENSDNNSTDSDNSFQNKRHKIHFDFLIHKVHEQISWSENRLRVLRNEINKFDMLLDTYNESHKRDAANTITTAQQIFAKKNQIGSEALKTTIDNLQKVWEDSEKLVNDLEHQNEELRQKKVKNDLNFANEKARLKMLRSASLECYKKQLSEMKNKAKQLRRLINSKADEYDLNCESLLSVFNKFDEKVNGQNDEVKKIWNKNQNENEIIENNVVEEEEEEIVEDNFADSCQAALLNELSNRKKDLENDIKVLRKQLKKMIFKAKNKDNASLSHIEHLQNKEKRNQTQINAELSKMQKLPQNKSYKYFDKIDASMLKLDQILENA